MIVTFVSHLLLHYTIIIFKISPDIDLLGTKLLLIFILLSLLYKTLITKTLSSIFPHEHLLFKIQNLQR